MRSSLFVTILISAALGGPALAADVKRTIDVNASAEEVWAMVGPFCAISDWYPGIDSCAEETVGNVVHRRLVTADGAEFFEKRLARDEAAKNYSYAILEGPLPVKGYKATFAVERAGDTATVIWTSNFEPDGVSEEEAVEIVGGVYDTGLQAIQGKFAE